MRKFHPLKNVLTFTSVLLFFYLSGPANAAETDTQNNTSTGQTQHPLLIPALPETDTETETIDNVLEEDDKLSVQPVELAVEPTPQPPLIDVQPEPKYEPDTNDSSVDQKHGQTAEQTMELPVEPTPQPPLIDAQPAPSYEPDTADSAIEQSDLTSTTQTPVPLTVQPINAESIDTEDRESEKDEQQETKIIEHTTKWSDTRPERVSADWLQLKSGEWLRGRITVMQNDSLEFDSDELKDLVIKWKNVKYLKSYEPYSLRFDSLGRMSITGIIEVRGDKVNVKTDYDEKTYDRSDLLTIASGKETEISLWKSKVTFSLNARKGNTDQTDFTSKMTAKRRTTDSRLILDYLGNFTQVQETETINNHRLNETYDIFLSRNLFWTPIFSEFFRDPFQNIEQRINIGVGIGYSLINTNESEWNITGGPSYQETSFVSVQSGADPVDSTLTLVLGTKFDTELNSIVDLEGLYSVSLGDEETGNYTHHAVFTIETELTDELDFDVSAVWDHVRSPVADENNITPNQDDFRIMVGLGYDL